MLTTELKKNGQTDMQPRVTAFSTFSHLKVPYARGLQKMCIRDRCSIFTPIFIAHIKNSLLSVHFVKSHVPLVKIGAYTDVYKRQVDKS